MWSSQCQRLTSRLRGTGRAWRRFEEVGKVVGLKGGEFEGMCASLRDGSRMELWERWREMKEIEELSASEVRGIIRCREDCRL